jgi:NADH-quinone oxidoreductase subunit J
VSTTEILFYVFSILALISAAGVILNVRNTVYAALCLVMVMLSLAVLFIVLEAQFIGILQVMVYAGAIVVLFLFVIMLLNLKGSPMGADSQLFLKLLGGLIVAVAGLKLAAILRSFEKPWPEIGPEFGTVKEMGTFLYTDYVLAVEIAGVLLLAGIVGAVVLAKQRTER